MGERRGQMRKAKTTLGAVRKELRVTQRQLAEVTGITLALTASSSGAKFATRPWLGGETAR